MYQGKHSAPKKPGKKNNKSKVTLISVLAFVLVLAIGGTLAWLVTKSSGITNTFDPSHVSCEVTENFNGTTKSNVNVKNTSDIDAYLRVKLVTYRVNDAGQHIGGTATIPSFTLGTNWVKHGDYYYYTVPVQPNASTENLLDKSISLQQYTDADGGKQVIEVMAEAIQSLPDYVVQQTWGVTISQNSVTDYTASN